MDFGAGETAALVAETGFGVTPHQRKRLCRLVFQRVHGPASRPLSGVDPDLVEEHVVGHRLPE